MAMLTNDDRGNDDELNDHNSKDYDNECDDDDDIDKTNVCEHGKLFQLIYGHIMHRRWLLHLLLFT